MRLECLGHDFIVTELLAVGKENSQWLEFWCKLEVFYVGQGGEESGPCMIPLFISYIMMWALGLPMMPTSMCGCTYTTLAMFFLTQFWTKDR